MQYVGARRFGAARSPLRLSATILNACRWQADGRWAFFNGLHIGDLSLQTIPIIDFPE